MPAGYASTPPSGTDIAAIRVIPSDAGPKIFNTRPRANLAVELGTPQDGSHRRGVPALATLRGRDGLPREVASDACEALPGFLRPDNPLDHLRRASGRASLVDPAQHAF
jgi:hypothetical protein